MSQAFRIFGVPFAPPNSPERLNLKLAYVYHLLAAPRLCERFNDPYDVIRADLAARFVHENAWVGKMPVDSWLTPRPRTGDLSRLTVDECTSFLESNGCWDYALRVAEFVEAQIFPYSPVMIGVDHSLTGGLLSALARRYRDLNVIVLDAHFDVMKCNGFMCNAGNQGPSFYHCGNFLSHVLERGIICPENLWILGVQQEVLRAVDGGGESLLGDDIKEMARWIDSGVHVLSNRDIAAEKLSMDLNGPTYVSIDMDVGSLSSVFSARFMNCYGLSAEEFLHVLSRVAECIVAANVPLLGLDVMEIDIHFLEAAEEAPFPDHTRRIVGEIFHLLLEADSMCPDLRLQKIEGGV